MTEKTYNFRRDHFMFGEDARKCKAWIRKYWKRHVRDEEIIDMRVDKSDSRYIVMTVSVR